MPIWVSIFSGFTISANRLTLFVKGKSSAPVNFARNQLKDVMINK